MKQVNIHEAKTTLSKLVAGLEDDGEAVALCRAGKPVAMLAPLPPKPLPLKTGLLRGQIWVSDDFEGVSVAEAGFFGIGSGV